MGLAKTHLSFSHEDLIYLKSNDSISQWLDKTSVSPFSMYKDDIWNFEGPESYRKEYLTIEWNKPFINNQRLKDFPNLYETVKRCLFFIQTTLETGRVKKPLTITSTYLYFHLIVNWMIENNIHSFSQLTEINFKEYYKWICIKKTKNGTTIKDKRNYIYPFYLLNTYRSYLNDTINKDFLNGESIFSFLNFKKSKNNQTKSISNETLNQLLTIILPIVDTIYLNKLSLKELYESKILPINNYMKFVNHINAIAYIIIGIYTGMRVSEILSIKKDSIKIVENTVLIKSLLFKTTSTKNGREENWACGLNNDSNYALKIIKILERLTPHHYSNLFFKNMNNGFAVWKTSEVNNAINNLLNTFYIKDKLATHQFRRTFAKLIGTTDKTNLLALQQHFKHVSISMTSYYVGNEVDLLEMINEEKQFEIAVGLESILSSDKLGGKLGEKISKSNHKFRGQAGKQLRKDYIETLLHDSDLIIMPHEYGFCIYQPEQARCQGEQKNIGINTCVKCSNFVVSSEHKVFWTSRVNEYEKFTIEIQELPNQENTVKELKYNINEAKQIIDKIEGEYNEATL